MRLYRMGRGRWQFIMPGFCLAWSPDIVWFRVFGYGLKFDKMNLFSDRNHIGCHIHVGRYVVRTLQPRLSAVDDEEG